MDDQNVTFYYVQYWNNKEQRWCYLGLSTESLELAVKIGQDFYNDDDLSKKDKNHYLYNVIRVTSFPKYWKEESQPLWHTELIIGDFAA